MVIQNGVPKQTLLWTLFKLRNEMYLYLRDNIHQWPASYNSYLAFARVPSVCEKQGGDFHDLNPIEVIENTHTTYLCKSKGNRQT